MKEYLVISEDVKAALAGNKPVVALESTIISQANQTPVHGNALGGKACSRKSLANIGERHTELAFV